MIAALQLGATSPVTEAVSETVLMLAGVLALVWQINRAKKHAPMGVAPWSATWLDFGIWFWVIACMMMVGVSAFKLVFGDRGRDPADEFGLIMRASSWHSAVLITQLTIIWQRRIWSPWPINTAALKPVRIVGESLIACLAAYPLLEIVSRSWIVLLKLSQQLSTPTQKTVDFLNHATSMQQVVVMAFFAVLIAPVNEELFFRAGLYRFLKSRVPAKYALIAVNVLFALAHANLLTLLPLFLLGVLLTRLYERTGNIAPSILFHALFNLTNVVLILLFPDNASTLHSP